MLEPIGDVFDILPNETAIIRLLSLSDLDRWEVDYNSPHFISVWLDEDIEISIGDRRIYFSKIGK
jgi:hypothetical protein